MSSRSEFKIVLRYPDGSVAGYSKYNNGISTVLDERGEFLFEVEGVFPPRPRRTSMDWIEKILERGLPDCRKRFILYVGSRYLVNVKRLPEEEAVQRLRDFYYKGGGKIYDTWIRSVVRGVKNKGIMPPSLESLKNKDREMYQVIKNVLERK